MSQTGRTGQTGQRSDSIGRTVLQTVAQKCSQSCRLSTAKGEQRETMTAIGSKLTTSRPSNEQLQCTVVATGAALACNCCNSSPIVQMTMM